MFSFDENDDHKIDILEFGQVAEALKAGKVEGVPAIDLQAVAISVDWQPAFAKFDKNSDGGLSVAEFFKMLKDGKAVDAADSKTIQAVRKFMFSFDKNDDHKIDIIEFGQVAEALKAGKVEGVSAIDLQAVAISVDWQAAFAKFDTNSDGGLSVAEFFKMLKDGKAVDAADSKTIQAVRKFMFSFDKNDDHKIDIIEFGQVAEALKA